MTTDTIRPAQERRNFLLGILNGAIFKVTMLLIDSNTVLSWFLIQLGASNTLIGLVAPIRMGSSFLLQIFVSGHLQRRPYKLSFYRAMALVRGATLLGTALIIFWVPSNSAWLVILFFVLLTLYSTGAGLTGLAFMDMVAKAIPPTRRGRFFAQRSFWGGLLALAAGPLVGFMLSESSGIRFPTNVGWLFVGAFVTLLVAAGMWALIKEPPSEVTPNTVSVVEQARRGSRILRDNVPYRQYLLLQICSILADSAGAFYIVHAERTLGITAQMVGVYLTARTAATIGSNLLWGRISDRMGNRRLLQITYSLGLCMPLIALGIGWLGSGPAAPWLGWAYALVFLVWGAYMAGAMIARTGYMLDVIPPAQRSLYMGFGNTLLGVVRFAAMASGLLADWAGFAVLMLVSASFYGLSLLLTFAMSEPRAGESRQMHAAAREKTTA
jgi:MFS family permease